MALADLDAMRVLRLIQSRNDAISREFLARNRLLNEIRSDLYLPGTYVRDYLLEPETVKAESHRSSLQNARTAMLNLADEIGKVNEQQLSAGNTQSYVLRALKAGARVSSQGFS